MVITRLFVAALFVCLSLPAFAQSASDSQDNKENIRSAALSSEAPADSLSVRLSPLTVWQGARLGTGTARLARPDFQGPAVLQIPKKYKLPAWGAGDRDGSPILSAASTSSGSLPIPQASQKRNWIQRHPTLFGALVGFGGGFVIGSNTGLCCDMTVGLGTGLAVGGIGAGAGAVVGKVVGR